MWFRGFGASARHLPRCVQRSRIGTYTKGLRVARTIADLDHSDIINVEHVGEAIQYRSLDRNLWGWRKRMPRNLSSI
jgi:predicted ATPase with chaperone activity